MDRSDLTPLPGAILYGCPRNHNYLVGGSRNRIFRSNGLVIRLVAFLRRSAFGAGQRRTLRNRGRLAMERNRTRRFDRCRPLPKVASTGTRGKNGSCLERHACAGLFEACGAAPLAVDSRAVDSLAADSLDSRLSCVTQPVPAVLVDHCERGGELVNRGHDRGSTAGFPEAAACLSCAVICACQ
jgi:hypothetical protein